MTRRQRRNAKHNYRKVCEKDWYAEAIASSRPENTNWGYIMALGVLVWTEWVWPVAVTGFLVVLLSFLLYISVATLIIRK